jgi:hypothetical protein
MERVSPVFYFILFFYSIGPLNAILESALSGITEPVDFSVISATLPADEGRTIGYVESSVGLDWPRWEGGRSEIEMADVNLDGNIDLVSIGDHGSPYINTDEHGVMVYFGDGFGRWRVEMSGNFGYGGIAIGDVNDDDLPDIGYAMHHDYSSNDFGDQLIEVALGDGTGQNWTPWDDGLASQGESYGMFSTDFGDVDNDGDLDIAATSFGFGNPLMVYLNNEDGTWTHSATITGGNCDMHVFFGDINRDGNLDIASSYQDGSIFFGYGNGQFYDAEFNLPSAGFMGRDGLSLGDIDNDGGMDLAYIDNGGLQVWAFDEVESLWVDYSGNLPSSGGFEMAQLYDMNADGYCDVAAAGSGWVEIWTGDGNGNWTSVTSYNIANDPTCIFEAFRVGGDAAHNGYTDIVHLNDEGGPFHSYTHMSFYRESSIPQELTLFAVCPRGGEVFLGGSVRFTDWLSSVPVGENSTVKVELSTSGPSGPWTTLGEDLINNGRLQWTVPTDITSVDCYLRYTAYTASDSSVTTTPRSFVILNGPGDLQITANPVNPPITIPPSGGTFDYIVRATNNEVAAQSFNGWIMVTLPFGVEWGPVIGPVTLTLPGGGSIERGLTQYVPGGAPPGDYYFNIYAGVYPIQVWSNDSFPFTKLEPID